MYGVVFPKVSGASFKIQNRGSLTSQIPSLHFRNLNVKFPPKTVLDLRGPRRSCLRLSNLDGPSEDTREGQLVNVKRISLNVSRGLLITVNPTFRTHCKVKSVETVDTGSSRVGWASGQERDGPSSPHSSFLCCKRETTTDKVGA